MRLSKIIDAVDAMRLELHQYQTIPPLHQVQLEEGLRITFGFEMRLRPKNCRQKNTAYKLRSSHKKAHLAYLRILTEISQIYIPFILAVPPPLCQSLDTHLLIQHYKARGAQLETLQLDKAGTDIIQNLSSRYDLNQSRWYQRLEVILFPSGIAPPLDSFIG
jgi:hypothetical protein